MDLKKKKKNLLTGDCSIQMASKTNYTVSCIGVGSLAITIICGVCAFMCLLTGESTLL